MNALSGLCVVTLQVMSMREETLHASTWKSCHVCYTGIALNYNVSSSRDLIIKSWRCRASALFNNTLNSAIVYKE